MKKNDLLKTKEGIIRILEIQEDNTLVIDCMKRNMPFWISNAIISTYSGCSECELRENTDFPNVDVEALDADQKRIMYERYTLITPILPFVANEEIRSQVIASIAAEHDISKQTVRRYLCLYLVYQDIAALVSKKRAEDRALTQDEKNIRWSLNKFFYSKNKNSLRTAYTMMIKTKYCDGAGKLLEKYPSFYQFRYFYRKTRKLQNYYISRHGLKHYQRNNRPLTGSGVQEFAYAAGVGMVDATVCDIYLINDAGQLVGRPVLTVCVDAYSGFCLGYSLSWEGGTYSLRDMLLHVVSDKVEHCRKHGILIAKEEWDVNQMPGRIVSDQGSEYVGDTFGQLAELGVSITNLPTYRPELKGTVEQFFDQIQEKYKPHLKGKGVIELDFQERGSRDYRKDACITMEQFEQVIIRCILYCNTKRVIENFPFSDEMLEAKVKPYANQIWKWGQKLSGVNLIDIPVDKLILTLLPRIEGKFGRSGLRVNQLRYHHADYTEYYLSGKTALIAYNPDNASKVWMIENSNYVRFELIDSRFKDMSYDDIESMKQKQKRLNRDVREDSLQAEIQLASQIEAITGMSAAAEPTNIIGIRENRKKEQSRKHKDFAWEVGLHD